MKKIELEIEDKLYDELEQIYDELGLDLKSAINIFLHQSYLQKGIPFSVRLIEPSTQNYDTFMENPIINDLTF